MSNQVHVLTICLKQNRSQDFALKLLWHCFNQLGIYLPAYDLLPRIGSGRPVLNFIEHELALNNDNFETNYSNSNQLINSQNEFYAQSLTKSLSKILKQVFNHNITNFKQLHIIDFNLSNHQNYLAISFVISNNLLSTNNKIINDELDYIGVDLESNISLVNKSKLISKKLLDPSDFLQSYIQTPINCSLYNDLLSIIWTTKEALVKSYATSIFYANLSTYSDNQIIYSQLVQYLNQKSLTSSANLSNSSSKSNNCLNSHRLFLSYCHLAQNPLTLTVHLPQVVINNVCSYFKANSVNDLIKDKTNLELEQIFRRMHSLYYLDMSQAANNDEKLEFNCTDQAMALNEVQSVDDLLKALDSHIKTDTNSLVTNSLVTNSLVTNDSDVSNLVNKLNTNSIDKYKTQVYYQISQY